MEEDTSKYLGQDTLISYLREKNYRSSYHEFMDLHLDVIIASSSSFSNWKGLDEFWSFEFLKKAEKLRMDLKEKTKLEHSEICYCKPCYNPEETPGRLDSVVRELTIKKVNRASGTTEAYNENLINLYSGGGMDEVMKRLEEKFSPCCKTRRNKQLISIYFNS
ncbi:uncharacterized protein OCT59_025322 [Rhizophagus irregularis]|uniref:uncharacterized protein n=1 Tax=Rhizophagus irregularis TaxID=588596 RepID=UPI003319A419|nr:hypothetical protein OCT59_025322 [Rhizophagus irregularis]